MSSTDKYKAVETVEVDFDVLDDEDDTDIMTNFSAAKR